MERSGRVTPASAASAKRDQLAQMFVERRQIPLAA